VTTKHCILAGLLFADLLVLAWQCGRPRKKIDGTDLAFGIIQTAVMIWLALS